MANRRVISTAECDTFDEVRNLMQERIDNEVLMEAKIEQLASTVEALPKPKSKPKSKSKPKEKGFIAVKVMLAIALVFVLLFVGSTQAAYTATDINSEIASNPDLLAQYLRDAIAAGTYTFSPIAAPAGNDIIEGKVYYDSSANTFYGSKDGSTWTEFATGGATSLDAAYNVGYAIDVDGTGVTLDNDVGDGTILLILTQDDITNDPDVISIANASNSSTAVSIDIDGTAGFDIQGTSDSWSVSIAGIFDGEGLTGVTHSQGILFDTNNEIQFGDNSEDVALVFSENTVTWATDTSVATMAFGAVDDLTGIGSIAFDDAASTITLTSTGATDLTISQATADQDASLILQSSGTGTDALSLISSVADIKIASADNIDIDAADNIAIDTAGGTFVLTTIAGDITIDSSTKSVIIRGTEEAADAVVIDADGTAGGITVDYGTGNLVITGTGASADFTLDADLISIDGTGASNITFTNGAAEDVTIETAGAADHSLILTASGTASDALQITTTAGGMDITNGGASGEDLNIDAVLSSLTLNSDEATTDAVKITSTLGGITMTSTAVASAWTHTATGTADDLTISVAGETDSSLILSSAGTGEDALSILASGTSASNMSILIDTADGGITMTADGSAKGDIVIDAADDVTITAVGKTTMNLGAEASTWQGNLLPATIVKQTVTTGSLSSADCGYVNQVAVDAQTITLPATVAGLTYTIMCTAADGVALVTIELDNNDKFVGAGFTPADGEAMTLPAETQNYGDYIKVTAHADGWIVTELVGTWAEANP